jgi:hypothetical protein
MSKRPEDNVHGEGNYKASRDFNKAESDFVKSGKADEAQGKAAPKSEAERRELEEAERAARSRSRGEEPALTKPPPKDTGSERRSGGR